MSPATATALKWTGLAVAAIVAGVGLIFGFYEGVPAQQVILYTAATFALVAWVWRSYTTRWAEGASAVEASREGAGSRRRAWRAFARNYRWIIAGLVVLLAVFGICSATITGFFSVLNIISLLVLIGLLVFSSFMSRFVVENRSAFIGLTVLVGLFVVGSLKVEGFVYANNIKSMLLFASFLGLACVGQTMVALLGGLDLSIPFVIGAANVGLLYLIGLGVPAWFAVVLIILLGVAIGLLNGFLSFRLQGQALILTLGIGFAVSGLTQILTSLGSRFAGNVFGSVPEWLSNLAAMNGRTFGLEVPPVIVIWLVVAALLIVGMKNTVYGRYLYALGGNRVSAARLSISERGYWTAAYAISGGVSAMTGALLLGWSGGGFIGVGQPYLFMTLAAVVIGGTSLLGGHGGYGFTVIGVLVLQVLTSFLVGIGLDYQWQQFIFGLLILPMVALYARSPHIRTQV
ncbi:ribose transport system permease protein [Tistlia consotensis]|uniref:Ribose transport system permease protein n=1 Tax=Tistlia consotensis USBA 355 TaxID=560819 RepID=A0A1Y6BUN6_9PROT|nr:ABC transporter permease [Tistlia consotensis]SMF29359.1 ribose transport system permease protein [Tistlia consotensis USBA 355]SNR91365.1 ribose transport system permease protein [Tistlia consotensis]